MEHQREIELCFLFIQTALHGTKPQIHAEGVDWEYFWKICHKNRIEALVFAGMDGGGVKTSIPEEIWKNFYRARGKDIIKETEQSRSLEELKENCYADKIPFLVLKGGVIRKIYPSPEMRDMADIDMLIHREDAKKVKKMLLDLGYEPKCEGEPHDSYFRRPYMNVEIHKGLFPQGIAYKPYFDRIWERAKTEDQIQFELSCNDFYIYMIGHMAKHFKSAGTGIRGLADIYVFLEKHQSELDMEYISKELGGLGLGKFEQMLRRISIKTIDQKALEEDEKQVLSYMIFSGVYGNYKHKLTGVLLKENGASKGQKEARNRYCLKRVFPPRDYMKINYSWIGESRLLLALSWVMRGIHVCVYNPKNLAELSLVKGIGKPEFDFMKKILEETGMS